MKISWRWKNYFSVHVRDVISQECECCPASSDCQKWKTRVIVIGPLIIHIEMKQ